MFKNHKTSTPPTVLSARNERKQYHKPSFEVIDINMESPLLTSSTLPTSKKSPVNDVFPGKDW